MGIINIFAVIEDSLYSVQYENETLHEFEKYFDLWNDPIYLREFFEEHLEDLKSDFWKNITIEEAITRTRKDANLLEKKLLEIAETGKTERLENLSTIFEPLSKGVIEDYEKDKAKGLGRNSWIRIYAIRIEANIFVVCGGAIKLTRNMNEREHLLKELNKLEFTRNHLMEDESDDLEFVSFN